MTERDDENEDFLQGRPEGSKWVYEIKTMGGGIQRIHAARQLPPSALRAILADQDFERVKVYPLEARISLEHRLPKSLMRELSRQASRTAIATALPSIPVDPLAPPKNSQFLLSLVTSREAQEEIIGDLDERYLTQIARSGLKRARIWYRWHAAQIAFAFGVKRLVQVVGLAKVLGLIRS